MNQIKNKALSIQVSLNGHSFCVKDLSSNKIENLWTTSYEKSETPYKLKELLEKDLAQEVISDKSFSEVLLIHRNELSTFVPQELFDKNHLADYLKFNAKILASDYIAFENLDALGIVNVYVPWMNINNMLLDRFGEFTYNHSSTVVLETVSQVKSEGDTVIYINLKSGLLEMVVMEESSLLFYNMFEVETQEDLIYHLLFTIQQLGLDVEKTPVRIMGGIEQHDHNFEIVYKYVRDVELLDSSNFLNNNNLSEKELSNNFILLNSFS